MDIAAMRPGGGALPGTSTKGFRDIMKVTLNDDGKIVHLAEFPDTYTLGRIKAAASAAAGSSVAFAENTFAQPSALPLVLVAAFAIVAVAAMSLRAATAPRRIAEPALLG